MQANLIAPCPLKPSSTGRNMGDSRYLYSVQEDDTQSIDLQDACLELQQILQYNSKQENIITRTRNPMVQDSSFIIPLHQAVSQLNLSRPRSHCIGDRSLYMIQ